MVTTSILNKNGVLWVCNGKDKYLTSADTSTERLITNCLKVGCYMISSVHGISTC